MRSVTLYLAVGVVFALAASAGFKRGGLALLALITLVTTVAMLVVALLDMGRDAGGETAFGFPVLLAIVPPPVTAGVIHWLATIRSSGPKQWLVGMLVWIVLLVPIGVFALLLNWVTF